MLISDFLEKLPEERRVAVERLRQEILEHLPGGFVETVDKDFIHYQVPLSLYPQGYHVTGEALPFISLASQKNYTALYHMGLYMSSDLAKWFAQAYKEQVPTKLDMGKSCIRLKNVKHIPYGLIGELAGKLTVAGYLALYEEHHLKD